MSYREFTLTFENYWGEDLILVEINFLEPPSPYGVSKTNYSDYGEALIRHVSNGQHITLDEKFPYYLDQSHYWRISFITKYGQTWASDFGFTCQIKPEDNDTVIIGINGDSKRMYVAFPESSTCSTSLHLI